ncbi:MAG: lamin tail domain-containing protein [Candidatus Paceibacterota bacterium]
MKKISVLFFFLIVFPFQSFGLFIVEVQISGENSSNDYIKIYNEGEEKDIGGYKLRKRTETGKEYSIKVFPKGSIIAKNGYFIWANSKDDFHLSIDANIISSATIAKNNSIALIDKENNIIDSVSWGKNEIPFDKNGLVENPAQKIIRKSVFENYQNTKNNNEDFYFYPPADYSLENLKEIKESEIKIESEETKKIDINNAPLEDLVKIIHIGEARAKELISLRPFYSFYDLTRIKGIGEKGAKDIEEQGFAFIRSDIIKETLKEDNKEPYLAKAESYNLPSKNVFPSDAVSVAIIISVLSAITVYFLKKSIF